jgi:hypothetical protein
VLAAAALLYFGALLAGCGLRLRQFVRAADLHCSHDRPWPDPCTSKPPPRSNTSPRWWPTTQPPCWRLPWPSRRTSTPGWTCRGAGRGRRAGRCGCAAAFPADAPPLQRLRLLNRYFFQELGFAGNVNDYYDPRNSYLPDVLRTRRGIPITLALLYVELATQAGLQAAGVSFPGHFLVKLRMPRGEVVIDPFSGQSLSREDLDERLMPYRASVA